MLNIISMMTSAEPIELTGGKTGGDGHANVSAIVEWAPFFESHIVRD